MRRRYFNEKPDPDGDFEPDIEMPLRVASEPDQEKGET